MKSIKNILLLITLWLGVTICQTNAEEIVNSDPSFTQQDIKKSINAVIDVVEHDYIFPEKSKLIANKLTYKLASDEFKKINELDIFVNELSVLLRNVSGDGYLNVTQTKFRPEIGHSQTLHEQANTQDFSFKKAEILQGNIGYLKLNNFYQNSQAQMLETTAFEYLSGASAIIIDLRGAEGYSIPLAQYMLSFFVEHNTTLSDVLYDRQTKTESLKSIVNVGKDHLKHDYPVYILTSAFTSGAGEFFSYTLKHFSKAVIVGEQTMGVASISKKQTLNEFISISLPIAMPIHPVTNTNWEQEGVIPDYNVKASDSFDLAYKLAKEHLGLL